MMTLESPLGEDAGDDHANHDEAMILFHSSIVAADWGDWKFTRSETSIELAPASTTPAMMKGG